jgi:hypothetical protein
MTAKRPVPRWVGDTESRGRGRPPTHGASDLAMRVSEDTWRPDLLFIDRTCLFCSRLLASDQRVCEHCGALAP